MYGGSKGVCCAVLSHSVVSLCDPWTVACQAPLSMGFSRQEYWSGLPFPTPVDLIYFPDGRTSLKTFNYICLAVPDLSCGTQAL